LLGADLRWVEIDDGTVPIAPFFVPSSGIHLERP
jgi:hypothetical protein